MSLRRLPPLTALRAFEAAARHLSFVKAAAELSVTPAAVSHQVKALEADLGRALFSRLANGLALTDDGRALLPGLTEGFDHLARAASLTADRETAGRLTISVLPSLAVCWLAPRLPDFHRRHPEVELTLLAEDRPVHFQAGEADMAIRYGAGRYPGLRADLLMTEEVMPVCVPTLRDGDPPLRKMGDIRRHTLLHDLGVTATEPWLSWRTWLRAAKLTDVDADAGHAYGHSNLTVGAALAGLGVAIGRSVLIADHLRDGSLVPLFGLRRPADYAYYVVSPEARADQPRIAAMRTWLFEMAGRSASERPNGG